MSMDNFSLIISVEVQQNREITLKMKLFNYGDTDYFIKAKNFPLRDFVPTLYIQGPSPVECSIHYPDRDDISNQGPFEVTRIPGEDYIETIDLPLSGVCYFSQPMTGVYTVVFKKDISVYKDENAQFYAGSMLLSGEANFELD